MKKKDDFICFAAGAAGYPLIELLWRGHTHWTMSCTGGICLAGIRRICSRMRRFSLPACCAACSGLITATELAVGLVVNRVFRWKVWDYSRMPVNLWGQICLGYSLLWMLLSLPLCLFFRRHKE